MTAPKLMIASGAVAWATRSAASLISLSTRSGPPVMLSSALLASSRPLFSSGLEIALARTRASLSAAKRSAGPEHRPAIHLPWVGTRARSGRATPGLVPGLQRPAEQEVSLARGDRAKRDDTATDLGARASASSNGRPVR